MVVTNHRCHHPESMHDLVLKNWVYSLPVSGQRVLQQAVVLAKSRRLASPSSQLNLQSQTQARQVPVNSGPPQDPSRPASPSSPSLRQDTLLAMVDDEAQRNATAGKDALKALVANDDFAVLASETLNTLFLDLMKEALKQEVSL
jgi:hypothetical protein